MDSGGSAGTTVTVGSVSELAAILANMPPEQLQNVQLDPILYNALFQTLDSNPQILDGNNQVIDHVTNQGNAQVNSHAIPAPTSNVKTHGLLPNQQVIQNVSIVSSHPAQSDVIAPLITTQSGSMLKITKPSAINKLQSNNAEKPISSLLNSPKKNSVVSSKNVSLQNKSSETPPQVEKKNIAPKVVKRVKSKEVDDNNENILHGIPPGQCSSLIVTPTVMSQLMPTPSIQSLKTNGNVTSSQFTQVVTLPSNAYLQPTVMQSLKIENGQVTQVSDPSITNTVQGVSQGVRNESQVYQKHHDGKQQELFDGNVIISDTIASNSKGSQIPVVSAAISNEAICSIGSVENSHFFSLPLTTLHVTENAQQLENDICVDNTSAIVLTSEQLSEIMAGKSLEEVLQGSISEQESVVIDPAKMSYVDNKNSKSNVVNKIKVSDVHTAPIRSTEARHIEQNVFEMKYNGLKGNENHVLPRTAVKSKLSPKRSVQFPSDRRQANEKNNDNDLKKIQALKPTAQFADIKKNIFSISPSNSSKTISVTPVCKESKVVITSYSKVSAFTPYRPSIVSAASGIKHVDSKVQGNYAVSSGISLNQATNNPSQKNIPEPHKSNAQGKIDTLHKSIFKSPTKKIFSTDKTPQSLELNKQSKMVSPANVIKSVVNHAVHKADGKRKPHDSAADVEKEKPDLIKSGKVTFNRSFKKTSPGGEAKKRIKKTLKEMEKTYPKEVNEILTIREAIKSSHVGDGESAMRQLAKLEIENQLKRFSQKVNAMKNVSPEKRIDYRRRKGHNEVERSNRGNKTDGMHEESIEADKKNDSGIIKDQVRKRERPKKFDDFVLGSKPKKDKKMKSRKFFFPEDMDDRVPCKTADNEHEGFLLKDSHIQKESLSLHEGKDINSLKNNDKKDGGKNISASVVESNIQQKKNNVTEKELTDCLSGNISVESGKEKSVKEKVTSPEKKESESAEKQADTDAHKNANRHPGSLEERSFLDAISGDAAPVVKIEDAISQKNDEVTQLDTSDKQLGDSGHNLEDIVKDCKDDSIEDSEKDEQSFDADDHDAVTPKTKTNNKVRKRKKKKKPSIAFEPEVLPEHLKKKPKITFEETVIDLSKVQLKSSCIESSFELNEGVELQTCELLKRHGWACTFCGKPGNIGNLDVLFGPYLLKVSNTESEKHKTFSVWMHRDCAIWTSSICLSNQTLCGLGDALNTAAKMACSLCNKVGATLQCSSRQCRDNYHFVCAKQRGCAFKIDNFTIICPKHN